MAVRVALAARRWISARDGDGPVVYAQWRLDPDGRVVVRKLYLAGEMPITAATLRAIPLARIEALLNDPQTLLPRSGCEDGPDFIPPVGEPPDSDWPQGRQLGDMASGGDELVVSKQLGRLSRPGVGGAHGDDFYKGVAQRYRAVMLDTTRPAVMLANEASVPVTTVHGSAKREDAATSALAGKGRWDRQPAAMRRQYE